MTPRPDAVGAAISYQFATWDHLAVDAFAANTYSSTIPATNNRRDPMTTATYQPTKAELAARVRFCLKRCKKNPANRPAARELYAAEAALAAA
jgi:hypothetical protein